jgi:predicted O-methyltransferase YrrM
MDFGTGPSKPRTVADIARSSLSSPKNLRLLFRIVSTYKFTNVLELGSSLGISTAYLAGASSLVKCVSIEGNKQIASMAVSNCENLGINNVSIIEGNIDTCLDQALLRFETLDFVFIDANHRSVPLINYFEKCVLKTTEQSIIVIDDINWSEDMNNAWSVIKSHTAVTSTISTYQLGIVFFNKNLTKNHYHMIY